MALILAPSYANEVRNKYYMENTLSQSLRDYVDTFGFCQKNLNAMDIIIEDTKSLLASWGGEEPDFMLVAPKLCFQLTMTQVSFLAVFVFVVLLFFCTGSVRAWAENLTRQVG
jgi:hypothetical protein